MKTDVYVCMLQIGKKYSHHTYPFINYQFNTCSEIVAPVQRFKEQNVWLAKNPAVHKAIPDRVPLST